MLDKNTNWFMDEKIDRTKKALEEKGYRVYVAENSSDMLLKVSSILEKGSKVSFGGSMTLIDSGLIEELRKLDINLLDRYKEGLTPADIGKLYRDSFYADYYITSTNALTEGGYFVNLDGNGNRVSAMTFGPKKVIFIAGYNKIVNSIEEAIDRVRGYAAPVNSKRLNRKTPCTTTGMCMDCNSPERICNHLVVTYRQNSPERGIVILVKEELGY